MASRLCSELGTKIDTGILEELVSLFNLGILKLYTTIPKYKFDPENSRLTLSQCFRIKFEGKEEIERLKKENEKLRECVGFYADFKNWKRQFTNYICIIDEVDHEARPEIDGWVHFGGKLARETLRGLDES